MSGNRSTTSASGTRAGAAAPAEGVPRRDRRRGVPPDAADELWRENLALRHRAAWLGAAVRRLGASLDAAGARARRGGRSRTEHLDDVGRQLLVPLTSIKGSTATALEAPADLDADAMLQLFRIIDEQADHMADLLGRGLAGRGSGAGTASGREREGSPPGAAAPAAHDHASGAGADRATGRPAAPRRVLPAAPTASVRATPPASVRATPTASVPPAAPTASVRAAPTASVRAAPRRAVGHAPFRLGDLALDPEQRRVTVAGRRVDLTATEYALLRALSADAGGVSTADALLRRVWGGRRAGGPNLLRTFVRRLRGKLGDDPGRPAHIITERGIGYRLAAPGDGYRLAAPGDGPR